MANDETKIGDGHLAAMARLGLNELRGACYADSNVSQPPQYGIYGVITPSEVSAGRDAEPGIESNREASAAEPQRTAEHAPQPLDLERD